MKSKENRKSIVLVSIIIVLLIICIFLLVSYKHLEERNDYVPYSSEYISHENALDIVLKDLNLNKNEIYDLDIELEKKYQNIVYEIDFDYHNLEYEYYVDATNGNIIKSFVTRD